AFLVKANANAPLYYGAPQEISPANPPPPVMTNVPPPTVAPPAGSSVVTLPQPVSPAQAAGSASASSAPSQIALPGSVSYSSPLPQGVSLLQNVGFAPNGQAIFSASDARM